MKRITMPSSSTASNENIIRIIKALAEDPRRSIREVSSITGLKYMYVRRSIQRLHKKGLITFTLMISSNMVGNEVAIVKLKGSLIDLVVDELLRCSRVIMVFKVNHSEMSLLVYGKNKQEIAEFIDFLKSSNNISEIDVEYGVFSNNTMIPVKSSLFECKIPHDCRNCLHNNIRSNITFIQ
ncbi:MAG: Lrp/AsnC family transcriptional regulator [Desulfurococcaceae archaeon]